MMLQEIEDIIDNYFSSLKKEEDIINALNKLRCKLHENSPFSHEPVDCVLWVRASDVSANDYNPNVMAPPEKKLLKLSIEADGFTQPIVVTRLGEKKYCVIDGFHRFQLGKSSIGAGKKLKGWLPITVLPPERHERSACIAATIRHNRARGKHKIASMSDIVRDLCRLGWNEQRIGDELGMDADEVLRLKQISGLTEMFETEEYSEAWTPD